MEPPPVPTYEEQDCGIPLHVTTGYKQTRSCDGREAGSQYGNRFCKQEATTVRTDSRNQGNDLAIHYHNPWRQDTLLRQQVNKPHLRGEFVI
jgi:hypothetical protein